MSTRSEREFMFSLGALQNLGEQIKEYVKNKRADEIANEVMNMQNPPRAEAIEQSLQGPKPTPPATGGIRQFNAQRIYQDLLAKSTTQDLKDKVLEAQARRYNSMGSKGDDDSPPTPVIDDSTGLMWNGKHWIKPPSSIESWTKHIPMARGKLDEGGSFTNQYTGAEEGDMIQLRTPQGQTVVVPYEEYQKRIHHNTANGDVVRPQVNDLPEPDLPPDNTTPSPSKQLDPATAKAILAEAGGDKEKARALARQRGYSF